MVLSREVNYVKLNHFLLLSPTILSFVQEQPCSLSTVVTEGMGISSAVGMDFIIKVRAVNKTLMANMN